jgi:hypothetical protein
VRLGYGIFYPTQVATSFFQQAQFQHPSITFTQTTTDAAVGAGPLANYVFGVTPLGSNGVPNYPTPNLTTLPVGALISSQSNGSSGWYDPNLRDQYEQVSHAGYARQVGANQVISADYTHIQGVHEWRPLNINPLCTTNFQGPCASPGFTGPAAAVGARILSTATRAVFNDPNLLGPMSIDASIGRSRFDELAIAYQHRGNRVTLQASYVLSYAYAWGANVGGLFVNASAVVPEIPSAYGGCVFCAGEWGPGQTDQRHRVTIAGLFKVPFGFEVSPTMTFASALPYQQYRAPNPDGDGSLRCFAGGPVPLTVASCTTGTAGVTPEVAINAARGQPLVNISTRVSRDFNFTETRKLTGFVELYNIPNRANFGSNYGINAFSPATFNQPIQYIGGPGSSSTVPNSFQMQLGARFSF